MLGIANLLVGFAWGGMVFFAAAIAPVIFKTLPVDEAGGLVRRIFPVYYLVLGIVTTVTVPLLLVTIAPGWTALLMALVAAGFWYSRQGLMPAINRQRDADAAGTPGARETFERLHRASVIINVVQILLCALVLWRLPLVASGVSTT